ncbi:MAG: metallophosphoesterase, partial [Rhizobiales bacterium]|nr:metallophosphoesterase [Hyphomicrobiales bacterium]
AADYERFLSLIRPLREFGVPVHLAMGNHDDRATFRHHLLPGEHGHPAAPVDRVDELNGLRIVTLDTTVPGFHHGEVTAAQREWLADVLSAKDSDTVFSFFCQHAADFVTDAARKAALSGDIARADRLAQLSSQLGERMAVAQAYNLDRKQTIISVLDDIRTAL